jgi:hypothetical protein
VFVVGIRIDYYVLGQGTMCTLWTYLINYRLLCVLCVYK